MIEHGFNKCEAPDLRSRPLEPLEKKKKAKKEGTHT